MTVRDVIFVLAEQQELTKAGIAEKVGCAKTTLYTQLCRNNGMGMKVSTLLKILEAMDFQMIIQSVNTDDEFVLDGEDEGLEYEWEE